MTSVSRLGLLAALLTLGIAVTGCATVQPWQRGRLASPCMQFSPDGDLAAFASHWQESREGAAGGATLHVRAAGAMALELQHLSPIVLERVNGFFGYAAVEKISLHQGPMPTKKTTPPKPKRTLAADETASLDAAVANTTDPDLRSALRALGERVAQAQPAAPKSGPRVKRGT